MKTTDLEYIDENQRKRKEFDKDMEDMLKEIQQGQNPEQIQNNTQ